MNPQTPPNPPSLGERVLLLTPTGQDSYFAALVLREAGLPVEVCADIHELCSQATLGSGALVIAVEALNDGGHLCLADFLRSQPAWSDVPVILITNGGEPHQHALFDYFSTPSSMTLLERPFRPVTLVSTLKMALRARLRQYEVRDLLQQRDVARHAAEDQALQMAELARSQAQARTIAEHASSMKDEFLATLSHELRTPMSAILGWAQLLRSGAGNADDLKEGLETIERNARAQTQLIGDLLDMSRIISGKVRLEVQSVDPATCIDAALDTLRPAADAKGIKLHKSLDPLAGPVSGDPARLHQILWNLLSNAVKFTPRGGDVYVQLRQVNPHVEISVTDTGEGILSDFLPHVFERFRQADSSTTRRHGGLGLGLSIVKQLVELHGGTIRVTSPGSEKGTTFTILLPVNHAPTTDPAPRITSSRLLAPASSSPGTLSIAGVRVLIVDDEPDARTLLKRVLEGSGAKALTAPSAADALEILASDCPDLIISDIGMPEVDGYEFLRRARAQGCTAPAIALTAFARSEDRTRALHAGYLLHVPKPVEPAELLATVAALAQQTATALKTS